MQQGNINSVDAIGSRLSLLLHCGVKLPGFNQPNFICNCEISFSIDELRSSYDWDWAKEKHDKGGK